ACPAHSGTAGTVATPCGADRTPRGIGFSMSHSSTLTIVHTAMRARLGGFQGRRAAIGEEPMRACGSLPCASPERRGQPAGAPIVQSTAVVDFWISQLFNGVSY